MENITITNKRIISFYENNNIDFEKMNLIFLDILENIFENINPTSSNISKYLFEQIDKISNKIDNINLLSSIKMNEFKTEYLKDIKDIFVTNKTINNTDIINMLENNNKLLLSNIILENSNTNKCILTNEIEKYNLLFKEELHNLSKNIISQSTIDNFLLNIKTDLNNISFFSEQRTDNKINDIKSLLEKNTSNTEILQHDIKEVLKKFERVSKGEISENILENILINMYSNENSSIENVSKINGAGDIHFQRTNTSPKIIIENKSHNSKNFVPLTDVKKFIKDCKINKMSGIMLSQYNAITHKKSFHIDIEDNLILLYIGEVKYNEEIIRTAINIVENLSCFINDFLQKNLKNDEHETQIVINNDILQEINKEYTNYYKNKKSLIDTLDNFTNLFKKQIDEIQFPSIEKLIVENLQSNENNIINNNNQIKCIHCNEYIKKSLKQHLRWCKKANETTI